MTTTIPSKYAELADLAEKAERHECSELMHTCLTLAWEVYANPATIQSLLRDLVTLREALAQLHEASGDHYDAEGQFHNAVDYRDGCDICEQWNHALIALEATQ